MSSIDIKLKEMLLSNIKNNFDVDADITDIIIEIPKDKSHGDYSTNVAMKFAKQIGKKPRDIAEIIVSTIDPNQSVISKVEIAGPGFINLTLQSDLLSNIIKVVLKEDTKYGYNCSGNGLKINCEYVSANPTGDLHLGHARGAAWADSVTRLLKVSGYEVTREYYINDAGNQIDNLAKSLYARYANHFGIEVELPDDGYHGEDVAIIAKQIAEDEGNTYLEMSQETLEHFKAVGIYYEMEKMKKDLGNFRVHYDVFTSERSIYERGLVEKTLQLLKDGGYTYELDGALWFKTTDFSDDKDRVLIKKDGSYTYLLPDIAYHIDKFERGSQKLVDFLGADHHGYIARLKAAMQALGKNSDDLEIDIIQMVRLVENGQEIKMSKRLGNAITLRELVDEVGVDAVRYFFVQRALDTHLDFDVELAKQQNNENPVYYAQYAHARICSILNASTFTEKAESYELLTHEKEIQLLKYINEFTNVISDAAKNRAPNKVCNYIQKLASLFHSFYGSCKVIDESNVQLSIQRLDLLKACKITLNNALKLVGVNAPDKM